MSDAGDLMRVADLPEYLRLRAEACGLFPEDRLTSASAVKFWWAAEWNSQGASLKKKPEHHLQFEHLVVRAEVKP